ncbi:hypothetical protein TSUD_317880 [Trifolium subterraneum]|uniref:S-acyltransferase n=1 Tax=Trifolium subterraneum TaxID=3900 RepID=A0A2Z6N335_TRISU|nr:hypothetical protein TSUD_317880 [Trifolium subterraneum]
MHPPAPATANLDGATAGNTLNPSLIRTYRAWKGNNVLIALVLTSGRDPGIVPRNSYPPVPEEYDGSVSINNLLAVLIVQYAITAWSDLIITAHGWASVLDWIQNSEEISIWKAMIKTPASIALIIYSFFCIWFVGGLTVFHTYLISTNQSTYENFRYRYDRQVNPYNKGIVENFKEVFFSSIPPSKNNFRSKVPIPKESTESSRRRGVDTLMMPVYNEVEEVGKDYKDEEYGKGSELSDTSVDLNGMLHTERGQRQVASFLRQSLWERSSRKWEVTPEVLDEIHVDVESKQITGDSSKETGDNTTKTDQ